MSVIVQRILGLALILALVALCVPATGCRDEMTARVAREASDRQARQNQLMGRIVEDFLRHHKEILEVQRSLHKAWDKLDGQWTSVESQRQAMAADRRTESMLVAMTRGLGWLFLTLVVLGLAALALFGLRQEQNNSADVFELMVRDVLPSAGLLTGLRTRPDVTRPDEPPPPDPQIRIPLQ